MSGRPNWYADHPPACTCASCRGRSARRGGRRRLGPSEGRNIRRTGQRRSDLGNTPPSRPTSRGGRSGRGGCGLVWLVMFLALAVGVAFVLSNSDMRSEITNWVNSQLGPEPTRVPVVGLVAHTPTPTSSPTPPTPTPVAVTPTSTPVPPPTHSPTVEPTSTATPIPTAVRPEFSIDNVDVSLVSTGDGLMTADLHVTIRNVTAGDAHRVIELLMSVDGGEPELISTISGITPGGAESFVFAREFAAGKYRLTLVAGDAHSEVSVEVDPASIAIAVPTATPTVTPTPQPTATRPPTATLTPVPTHTASPTYTPTPVIAVSGWFAYSHTGPCRRVKPGRRSSPGTLGIQTVHAWADQW